MEFLRWSYLITIVLCLALYLVGRLYGRMTGSDELAVISDVRGPARWTHDLGLTTVIGSLLSGLFIAPLLGSPAVATFVAYMVGVFVGIGQAEDVRLSEWLLWIEQRPQLLIRYARKRIRHRSAMRKTELGKFSLAHKRRQRHSFNNLLPAAFSLICGWTAISGGDLLIAFLKDLDDTSGFPVPDSIGIGWRLLIGTVGAFYFAYSPARTKLTITAVAGFVLAFDWPRVSTGVATDRSVPLQEVGWSLLTAAVIGLVLSSEQERQRDNDRRAELDQRRREEVLSVRLSLLGVERESLQAINLPATDLIRIRWVGANLKDANLSLCDLSNGDLSNADLSGSILSEARLRDTALRDANLSEADLTSAELTGADFTSANLDNTMLEGAWWRPENPPVWPAGHDPVDRYSPGQGRLGLQWESGFIDPIPLHRMGFSKWEAEFGHVEPLVLEIASADRWYLKLVEQS